MVQDMINCLNMLPSKNRISSELSPAAIILGSPNKYYNKLRITFGAYAQVYIGNTNSKKQKKVVAIALIPENERGGYYFMYLATGKQLHDLIWKEIPINDQVISRVNNLVTKENQTEMTKGYPIFEWIPGIPITDKGDDTQSEEKASTHEDGHDDDITEN